MPVSSNVGTPLHDAEWPGPLAEKFMRMPYSVELGAPELGNVCGSLPGTGSQLSVLTGRNCAISAGVRPSITQGLQEVTLWPTCGPFTVEPGLAPAPVNNPLSGWPFAATT